MIFKRIARLCNQLNHSFMVAWAYALEKFRIYHETFITLFQCAAKIF